MGATSGAVTAYLCHKWPRVCSVCRNKYPVLSPFMTYHRMCNKSNTPGTTHEAELPTLPKHLSSPPVFSGVRFDQSYVFCVVFCRSLFVLFLLIIVLSALLRITAFDYSTSIFNLLLTWGTLEKINNSYFLRNNFFFPNPNHTWMIMSSLPFL